MTNALRLHRARMRHWHFRWNAGSPLISVYIPTRNRADLLMERAIPSVLYQRYDKFELIVACHDCTDDTVDRVHGLRDARIRVLYVPREVHYPDTPQNRWYAGPVDPCNAALSAARGRWIVRLDDDDILYPHHLSTLLRFAQARNYEFVSAAHRTHESVVQPYDLDGIDVGGVQTWMYRSYLRFMKYNRDCWKKRFNRVNDTDLQDRFRRAGVRMGYLPEVVAKVLPRPGERHVGLKAYLAAE